jgi:hypothetical protein
MATSPSYDPELDALILELGASLNPSRYAAFLDTARAALASVPCLGPGSAFRILAGLQGRFFDPPPDVRIGAPRGPENRRASKLIGLPPIGGPDPREGARDRNRLKAV